MEYLNKWIVIATAKKDVKCIGQIKRVRPDEWIIGIDHMYLTNTKKLKKGDDTIICNTLTEAVIHANLIFQDKQTMEKKEKRSRR